MGSEKCKSCFKMVSSTSRAGLCKECVGSLETFKSEVAPDMEQAAHKKAQEIVDELFSVFNISYARGLPYANPAMVTARIIIQQQLLHGPRGSR